MTFFKSLPNGAKIYDVFARRPEVFRPFTKMVDCVASGESELTRGERELIGAYVSALNDCPYCIQVHSASAEKLGVQGGLVAALRENFDAAPVAPKLRPILALARKMTQTPYKVVQQDISAVTDAGWQEHTVEDAILIICIANFMNRFVSGFGLEADLDYVKLASQRISDIGFKPSQ